MPTFLCLREQERFHLKELARVPNGTLVHLPGNGDAHSVSGDDLGGDASEAVPVDNVANLDLEDRRVASVELDAEG